jgi:hypothetical protein
MALITVLSPVAELRTDDGDPRCPPTCAASRWIRQHEDTDRLVTGIGKRSWSATASSAW